VLTPAYSLVCATAFFLLLYYGVGFDKASSRAGYFFVMCLLTEVYAVTLGQAVAALSPSITVAALFNPFLLVMFSVFCGVVAPKATLPYFWRSWMYQLDPFTRLISGVVSTALWNQPVVCRDSEYSVFPAPSGQTCGEYAGAFAEAVGGYLGNPDATGDCNFCQYSNGQAFYAPLDISYSTVRRVVVPPRARRVLTRSEAEISASSCATRSSTSSSCSSRRGTCRTPSDRRVERGVSRGGRAQWRSRLRAVSRLRVTIIHHQHHHNIIDISPLMSCRSVSSCSTSCVSDPDLSVSYASAWMNFVLGIRRPRPLYHDDAVDGDA